MNEDQPIRLSSPGTQYTGVGSAAIRVQGAPEQGEGSEIYMLVLSDMIERAGFGAKKYGHPLRTTAGVDFLVNAYQEVLDLCIYLRGEIMRRENDDRTLLSPMDRGEDPAQYA